MALRASGYRVAVMGATGAVGNEMIRVLEERNFPVASLKLLASIRSAGATLEFRGSNLRVEELTDASFEGIEIVLASAGASVSQRFAPAAAAAGAVIIDNTSAFRMEPDIPLVVPEVNAHAIAEYPKRRIIANPNCSTIQMVVALKPIHDAARIKRIIVDTYQSTSGAGKRAMQELESQTADRLNGREVLPKIFPHPIAFNCLPHIDSFLDNGYTKEEMKMVNETRKILGDPSILVSATTVRVPVFYGHSEAVHVETERPLSPEEARKLLESAPGVEVVDEPAEKRYPTAIDAAGTDPVYVGRIRRDLAFENGLAMWVVSDNIRKGAALNAVQIAECLGRDYLG